MTLVNYVPKQRPVRRRVTNFAPITKQNPLVNIQEDDDGFEIQLAIPGVSKDLIDMQVEEDQLIISSKSTTTENEDSNPNFLRKEYDFSTFKKVFNLNEDIDQNAIKATLENGVLHITLAKKEEAKPIPARTIAIQ